jgi:hypothetical protein
MRKGSTGDATVRDFTRESRKQRLLTQARQDPDRGRIGYTARMLVRLCHPFRRSNRKAVEDVGEPTQTLSHGVPSSPLLNPTASTFTNRTPLDHESDPLRPLVTVIHGPCGDTNETDLTARTHRRADRRNPTVYEHLLELPEWPGHRAGQHVDVRLTAEDGYQDERSHSIGSAPPDGELVLTVGRLEDGEVWVKS